ncbi:putative olfactory receptor 14L1 isoform X2 [Mauremys mutica]|uniref:putative olfactory receptor 14L1 isoform X2 n=1 Tax=Mauremys mutica TaxID=74926 RepID=UPI001D16F0CC|nr:putative olfactory receptor 14L1 isoform X2 [Mauremys mutica]
MRAWKRESTKDQRILTVEYQMHGEISAKTTPIFTTVLRIPSEQGRRKAFSTCLPHLFVVSLFLWTLTVAYLKPTSSSTTGRDLMVAVLYSVVPPMMNPIIYSMRNKEIQAALRRLIAGRLFTMNIKSIVLP